MEDLCSSRNRSCAPGYLCNGWTGQCRKCKSFGGRILSWLAHINGLNEYGSPTYLCEAIEDYQKKNGKRITFPPLPRRNFPTFPPEKLSSSRRDQRVRKREEEFSRNLEAEKSLETKKLHEKEEQVQELTEAKNLYKEKIKTLQQQQKKWMATNATNALLLKEIETARNQYDELVKQGANQKRIMEQEEKKQKNLRANLENNLVSLKQYETRNKDLHEEIQACENQIRVNGEQINQKTQHIGRLEDALKSLNKKYKDYFVEFLKSVRPSILELRHSIPSNEWIDPNTIIRTLEGQDKLQQIPDITSYVLTLLSSAIKQKQKLDANLQEEKLLTMQSSEDIAVCERRYHQLEETNKQLENYIVTLNSNKEESKRKLEQCRKEERKCNLELEEMQCKTIGCDSKRTRSARKVCAFHCSET